jgi:SagB-type dehydrogenase family enzyme
MTWKPVASAGKTAVFLGAAAAVVLAAGLFLSMKMGGSAGAGEKKAKKEIKKETTKGGGTMSAKKIKLPEPDTKGKMTVEEAISKRRSVRDFKEGAITLQELGQILWAVQGCTGAGCLRAAPSAGATYPLEIFAVVGAGGVEGLKAGAYRYLPDGHELTLQLEGDVRQQLAEAALGQDWVLLAPVSFVFTADYSRTTGRYGQRGMRYVHIEVGHAGENLFLQAESLGLKTVSVGAFTDKQVAEAIGIGKPFEPLYIMPVGR